MLLVLAAFDINVRLKPVQQLDRGRLRIHIDPVKAFQRRQARGAEIIRNERPIEPLVHMRIRADRDEQDMSQRAGVLQMMNVAGMNDVEAAVAMDDGLAGLAGGGRRLPLLLWPDRGRDGRRDALLGGHGQIDPI